MRIGAHVSIAGSLPLAVDRAVHLGCECAQIFVGNPRQWRAAAYSPEDLGELAHRRAAAGIDPLVAHAPYLVNLASPDPGLRADGIGALVRSLRVMEAVGGLGVVTHIGSAKGADPGAALARVAAGVREALAETERAKLLLENSAGGTLGGSFAELRDLLALLDGEARVGICLDSAHLFAAGTDLRHGGGVARMLDDFDRVVGRERLWLFHLNDSRSALGSRLDRHENIGEGEIGRAGFRALLREPRLAGLGGILETPGFDQQGPDLENMRILRRLRGDRAAARRRRAPNRKG
jgi:deoxyribonuclease-4